MQTFDRIFGSGPRIHLTMISLMVILYYLRIEFSWMSIGLWNGAHITGAVISLALWGIIALWSLKSLGRKIGLSVLRSGPYAYVRHPMYAAEIFFGWIAVGFLLETWLALVAMVITFILARYLVHYEEHMLEQHFGDEWREYKKNTPAFFPYLSPDR